MSLLPALDPSLPESLQPGPPASLGLNDLQPNEVRVFSADVERWAGSELVELAWAALTEAEREHAERLRRSSNRAEFITGRGCLRLLLAACTGYELGPRALPLETGRFGKPQVAYECVRRFHLPAFNVAHSHGRVMLAFSNAGSIGVDLEYLDQSVETGEIARASFSSAEVAFLEQARSERERLLAFYACWTRKEAVAKADGRGLTLPIAAIPVFGQSFGGAYLHLDEPCESDTGNPQKSRYFVREIEAGANFLAAIAVPVEPSRIEVRELSPADVSLPHAVASGRAVHSLAAGNGPKVTYRSEIYGGWGMQSTPLSRTLTR